MINKRGSLVLRDIVFMMLIVTSIFIFAGLFVVEMGNNYDNTNMTNEWIGSNINLAGNSSFYDTSDQLNDTASDLDGGLINLLSGGLDAIGGTLRMVLLAPVTFGEIVSSTLEDAGLGGNTLATTIKFLIAGILYGIIIFSVASAFLQGGRL